MEAFYFVSRELNKTFEKLGKVVAIFSKGIIIVSLLSGILLGLGMIKLEVAKFSHAFVPFNCRSYEEQRIVGQLFPMNRSYNFDFFRLTNFESTSFVIITAKDKGTMLRKSVYNEIMALDEMITSFEIKLKNNVYTYIDICAKNYGHCYINKALTHKDRISQLEANETNIKYPIELDIHKMSINVTGIAFGGVKTDAAKRIVETKAMRLMYFLDNSKKEMDDVILEWENEFRKKILKYQSNVIRINGFVNSDYDYYTLRIILEGLKYGIITVAIINIFCVMSSMTSDWVTSKPSLAVAGCISVVLASLASTGVVSAIGIPITSINTAIPFLILGVGVDDMFLLIATWRTTDPKESVVNRLANTYSHAGTSITMTSLTNLIAFVVGATVPVYAIRSFCIHGALGVTFDLIYQLTFFGACMALDGYREEKKLHPLTLQPVVLTQDAGYRNRLLQIMCTNKSRMNEDRPPSLMTWCRDKLGYWISKKMISAFIIAFLILYTFGATWGITSLNNGLRIQNTFPYDSQSYASFVKLKHYFTKYTYPVQIVFNNTLDYSNPKVQKQVLNTINIFHRSKYIKNIEFNWLKSFLFISKYNSSYLSLYNLTEPKEFVSCLRNEFFYHPLGRTFSNDVEFDENGTYIVASRFLLISNVSLDVKESAELITEMRLIADSSSFSVTVQNIWWSLYELSFKIQALTIQTIGVTITATFLVFLLLSSNIGGAILVSVTMLSIEIGIIGYMSLLGITLNTMSFVILIMSIGFSLDPCIHVCYAYRKSDGTYQERIQETLFSAGLPVFQGCFSTIIGVLPLALISYYVFHVFVVLVCLLIVISFFHAIFVLPVLLGFRDIITQFFNKNESAEENKNGTSSLPQLMNIVSIIESSRM